MKRYTLVEHEDFIFPAEIRLAFDEHWQREQKAWGTLRDCPVRTADVTDLVGFDPALGSARLMRERLT